MARLVPLLGDCLHFVQKNLTNMESLKKIFDTFGEKEENIRCVFLFFLNKVDGMKSFACVIFFIASFSLTTVFADDTQPPSQKDTLKLAPAADKEKKPKITYRTVLNTDTYKKRPYAGEHVAIKVIPPESIESSKKKKKGFVYVEIYNESSRHLASVDFDIILTNEYGSNMSSHINGANILPKRSAVKKIAVADVYNFPMIKAVKIENLQVIDKNADHVSKDIFVDLVRFKKASHKRK